ncbi:MAG: S8 family serine peptidase [Desulfobacterales bacterium]|nr:S8 family serine peptidase [Desulfobacterales bacterium]
MSGYDMISDPGIANDGNGRDGDASDPGDAIAANECYPGSLALPSSWHGTHVAGTVGVGRTNNGIGVAGVNWTVEVQPVRVLGKCGGTMVDINDAIRWAAGLSVPGAPNNPTPAKVINMESRWRPRRARPRRPPRRRSTTPSPGVSRWWSRPAMNRPMPPASSRRAATA